MTRFRNFLLLLRAQLWALPLLISVSMLVLAVWILAWGTAFLEGLAAGNGIWWLYSGDADTARNLLSSLLSGLITMTSLIVSMTFVILTLAANQLGPRLILIFMSDRQIQSVLGLFLGTIVYVLIVFRSLDETLGPEGVPHIAVTVGSALTLVCLFALLFYVHKIARSIVADNIVQHIANDLDRNIKTLMPRSAGEVERPVPATAGPCTSVMSLAKSGYIQVVDYDELVAVACRHNAVFQLKVRAGHFVMKNGQHLVAQAERPLDEMAIRSIRKAFVLNTERSPAQDLEYGLRQLVEIALRALSPGINDPFTAIAVVNQLGAAIETILQRSPQPTALKDAAGVIRVIAQCSDAEGLVNAAFDAIRQAAMAIPTVLIRLADVLRQLAPVARSPEARGAILSQLTKLAETAGEARLAPSDRDAIMSRIAIARAAFTRHEPQEAARVL